MPFETQLGEPGIIVVAERDLQHEIIWQFKDFGLLIRHLDNERKDIKWSPLPSFPAEAPDDFGEFRMQGIPDDRTIRLPIACVTDELRIPDTDTWLLRCLRGKDGDRRANLPTIRRKTDVLHEDFEDILRSREVAHIAYDQ